MCVIIVKGPGKRVPDPIIQNCFRANPHGAGFALFYKKELRVFKGFFEVDQLQEALSALDDFRMVIHFRWRSAGQISKEACHPFSIKNRYALAHNGTIHSGPFRGDTKVSDTQKLAEWLNQSGVNPAPILNNLATNNRFAVLQEDSVTRFGNWHKKSGLWFSNLNWEPQPKSTRYMEECPSCGERNRGAKFICATCNSFLI